ncbi:hypothetical protein CAEBREN_03144 [Caenorhabditis brenneri]|uniref:Uncharacterized protein n=1 Tax=Caenorhabditis brenneri TaxID=135651 RepID=G0NU74_CAEBE|nr:hypothetical protein CAEBREN_03144 [Caenorhabditis brenneri]
MLFQFHQSNVPYIDSHCHTDFMFEQLNRNKTPTSHQGLHEWMDKHKDAFPKGFSGIIANFIKPELFIAINGSNDYDLDWIAREAQSDLYLGTTWGCHPHSVSKWGRSTEFWTTMEWIISKRKEFKVLAIGECGIDLHRCHSNLEDQRYVFEKHVELAFMHDLTLVIHCRNGSQGRSEEECLNILEKQMKKNHRYLKIHRHCFTEDWNTAQQWLKQCPDVHFGYTGAIYSFSERQIEAVRRIPLDRILLETDGPYFKPKCFEFTSPSKVCLPGMAIATAQRIADIKHLNLEEVLRATYNNTKRVYQIPVYDSHKKSNNRGYIS